MAASGALRKVLIAFLALLAVAKAESNESAAAGSIPDADAAAAAEFRQGGSLLGQPLYPSGSIYGANGYQQLMAAGGSAGSTGGYGGMLRNLYRPSSFGLTDKVRNWVKSFLNRRQYVKPYYNPSALLSYTGGEDKPIYINGNSYKAVSVPLRQLQKYYKPFYGSSAASQSAAAAESAAAAQYFAGSQSGFPGFGADSAALYASESSASSPLFSSSGTSGGIFSPSGGSSSSGLFGGSSSGFAQSGLGGAFSAGSGLYQPGSIYGSPNSGSFGSSPYASSGSSGLYQSGSGTDDLTASSSSGGSSSLYLSNSGGRNNDASYTNGELPAGYSYEAPSAGSYPVESAYSLSYQRPPQSPQTYGQTSFDKSSFQPVRFGASDGGSSFKGLQASNNGHSSSQSALYTSEQNS